MTASHLDSMPRCFVIPEFQQHDILDTPIFEQDGALPHIGTCVTQLLRQYFTNERIIGQNFQTSWLPWSRDFKPVTFKYGVISKAQFMEEELEHAID